MHWEKLGHIYTPPKKNNFLVSHAANPLPVYLGEDVYRIFYSGRGEENKSSVGYVDVDIITREVVEDNKEVVLKHGRDLDFHSHGISIGNLYCVDEVDYILFMAWKIENPQSHWFGTVGRTEVQNKKEFVVNPLNPYMPLDAEDPISLSYPWVLCDNDRYKMWYGSTVTWQADSNEEMVHVIKYATSENGTDWVKHGLAIPYEENVAQAFSRPSVIEINDHYHMWYSYRSGTGQSYRIGHAVSEDGKSWERQHYQASLDVSDQGWDSEMVCYPYVLKHKDHIYMLYNGNGFGKTGFGIAQLIN